MSIKTIGPIGVSFFILDSGAEDWHDIHIQFYDEDKKEVVEFEIDYTCDGHSLVDQLRELADEIESELAVRGLC